MLFVSHWAGSGGAEKTLFEIVTHAHAVLGIRCVCVVPWKGSLYRNLRAAGVPCYVVPYRWWVGDRIPAWKRALRTLVNVPLVLVLALIVLRTRATVVYSNTFTICVGALAALLTRRPHIWHIHEMFGANTFDLGRRFSLWLVDRLSDRIIVVSDAVARLYALSIAPAKIVRIHNALPPLPAGKSEDVPIPGRLVIVGYLTASKGHEDAVRALGILRDRGLDMSLHVVGDSEDAAFKSHLRSLVATLGLGERVEFTGQIPDPAVELRAAEAVLVCARGEAFGRVTVEAMLAGRPVIGANSGATPEIVQHGETGLLYEPGDVVGLAAAVESLRADPARAAAMAARARLHAERAYGRERFFREWRAEVRSVAAPKTSR